MASDFNTHGVVRLDKVHASYNGNLESVQHTANLDNGAIVQLGELVSGERELIQVKVPDATSINSDAILLVASPEIVYLAGMTMQNFYNKTGDAARAYHLQEGDIFTISASMISGTPTVGQWVEPAAGATLLAASATLPTTRFIGEVIESTTLGAYRAAAFTIRVRHN